MITNDESTSETAICVLIVDDDSWTTRAITLALDEAPEIGSLRTAHSGEQAIAEYIASRPDVTLMDLNMPPGMSGITAIEQIRLHDPTAHIVVLTTVSPGPGIARALEAGAIAVLRKTASENNLRSVVLAAARGEEPKLLKHLAQDIIISNDELPEAPAVAPRLTPAEREILLLIADGLGYENIAQSQGISVWTARTHVKRLREKLYADNLAQLVVRALQYRFISA
ncbi:response regulator transcription factor [Enteractinococcus helveticum]|uniref:response regulator transcription factor n=1 Tax=Enteractinococcus helveticum TaxID=1837282 RepID=UPI000A6D6AC1|nr:response regulator transcription factor [Enteractinococcus helveticum]